MVTKLNFVFLFISDFTCIVVFSLNTYFSLFPFRAQICSFFFKFDFFHLYELPDEFYGNIIK